MARVGFVFRTGKTLTYEGLSPSGSVLTAAATSLPEVAGTGYYTVVDANLSVGDIAIVREGSNEVGGGDITLTQTGEGVPKIE